MKQKQRNSINKIGFLLSVIGSTVGLGGIWGFPTQMYIHRGAFLIPFIICMIICAIPVLFLEMTIGNKYRKNHIEFFTEVGNKKGAFFAWLHSSTVIMLSTYYSVLIGWTLINVIISFTGALNQDNFFYNQILNITGNEQKPTSFFQLGGLNWKVLLATFVVWIILFVILVGGVDKGIDKANKVFIPTLFLMILILVIYTSTLPGAGRGLNVMLQFDGKELLNPGLWKDAFGQAFFMLSTCTGTIYIYAAHAPKNQDNTNHAFVVGLGTTIVGLLTAMIVFNAIGDIAYQKHKPFNEVFGAGGPTLIYQVLPQLFRLINQSVPILGNVISVMFFLTLLFAGMSSLIGQVESMVNGLEYEVNMKRIYALSLTCVFAMVLSCLFMFNNATVIITAVGNWIAQLWLLIIGLLLLIMIGPIGWKIYPDLQSHNNRVSWFKWNKVYTFLLLVVAPIIIVANIVAGTYDIVNAIIANPFVNGFFGLILGLVIPVILTSLLVFHQQINKFFTQKTTKKINFQEIR